MGRLKLSDTDVAAIRAALAAGTTATALAAQYHVTPLTIGMIRRGQRRRRQVMVRAPRASRRRLYVTSDRDDPARVVLCLGVILWHALGQPMILGVRADLTAIVTPVALLADEPAFPVRLLPQPAVTVPVPHPPPVLGKYRVTPTATPGVWAVHAVAAAAPPATAATTTTAQAAAVLGISRQAVHQALHAGLLTGVFADHRWFIDAASVAARQGRMPTLRTAYGALPPDGGPWVTIQDAARRLQATTADVRHFITTGYVRGVFHLGAWWVDATDLAPPRTLLTPARVAAILSAEVHSCVRHRGGWNCVTARLPRGASCVLYYRTATWPPPLQLRHYLADLLTEPTTTFAEFVAARTAAGQTVGRGTFARLVSQQRAVVRWLATETEEHHP